MLVKSNFFLARQEKLYERELSHILYKIVRENNLPTFSVSYCLLSGRGENLKIYLNFSQWEKKEEILKLIEKNYSHPIKKEIVQSKKFSYIPKLIFLPDQDLERINSLAEIINKIN